MVIIPQSLLMMAVFHSSSRLAKIDRHMRHHRVIPTAMPYISCLRRAKMQTALGTQNYLAPKIDMGRKNVREQMPTPVRAYQLCLSYVMCC